MKIGMKTLATLITLLLGLTLQAQADTSTTNNFDYTGNYALNFGQYLPHLGTDPLGNSNDTHGSASQFSLSQNTHLDYLNVDAFVVSSDPGSIPLPTTFNYKLYGGSTYDYLGATQTKPIPSGPILWESQPLTFTSSTESTSIHNGLPVNEYNVQVPVNQDVAHGTYWLAEEQQGQFGQSTIVYTTETYSGYVPSDSGSNTSQTPEPTTWILFAGFILFVIFKGRKYVALERMV